ncbi:MAG: hypothetical protein RIQ91_7 [Bacteroidota bacterium]
MAKLEKKRLTAFAIIAMVTIVVVVGLWLCKKRPIHFLWLLTLSKTIT